MTPLFRVQRVPFEVFIILGGVCGLIDTRHLPCPSWPTEIVWEKHRGEMPHWTINNLQITCVVPDDGYFIFCRNLVLWFQLCTAELFIVYCYFIAFQAA